MQAHSSYDILNEALSALGDLFRSVYADWCIYSTSVGCRVNNRNLPSLGFDVPRDP